jgi:hypothetical protein
MSPDNLDGSHGLAAPQPEVPEGAPPLPPDPYDQRSGGLDPDGGTAAAP